MKGLKIVKILFLGLLYRKEEEKNVLSKSKCGLQAAGNAYQWNLINGLDGLLQDPVTIISSLSVGSFPGCYNQLFVPSRKWSHTKGASDEEVGFINIPVLKQLQRLIKVRNRVKKWCRKYADDELIIITYSMYLPYLKILNNIKKHCKNIKTCVIVPDLPYAFGYECKPNSVKEFIRRTIKKYQYIYVKAADTYILLTENMVEPLGINGKSYVVVEGICSPSIQEMEYPYEEDHHILFYAGSLNQRFGIDKLIRAFHDIKVDGIQLWICGMGDYRGEIEKAATVDRRIHYYGYVSAEKIQSLMRQATILVNPRPNTQEYTKYSFPSKTIEYMLTGKPVLMYRLDGIPHDYDEYLHYIREFTEDSIKEAILMVINLSRADIYSKGLLQRDFILKQKTHVTQGSKVLNMLVNMGVNNECFSKEALLIHQNVLRILQVNITSGIGSTGRLVEEIHHYLLNNGVQSFIAYSAFSTETKEAFKIETQAQNYIRRALNRYIGRKNIHSTMGTRRLINKIKQLKPDLVHLHNIQQNSINFPMLLKYLKEYNKPVVYTLHDCWPFTGGCYHFTELKCDGYQFGCPDHTCKLIHRDRDICNRTTNQIYEEKRKALTELKFLNIICVSNWLMGCAQNSFMKELTLQTIYNGIDLEVFKPMKSKIRTELGISQDEFIILGVANNWNDKKGLSTFLNLSMILKPPFRIVMVGLSNQCVNEKIIAVNRTEKLEELVQLYSCADVFFNGSKEETFGMTTAEAMACGTPVIVYDSTACAELLGEGTGVVLQNDSLQELVEAINVIYYKGKSEYSPNCIENIKSRFSMEDMLKNYIQIYQQMIEEGREDH